MVAEKIAACIVPPSGACHLLEHTFKPVEARAEGCQVPFRTPRMPCPAWQVPPLTGRTATFAGLEPVTTLSYHLE